MVSRSLLSFIVLLIVFFFALVAIPANAASRGEMGWKGPKRACGERIVKAGPPVNLQESRAKDGHGSQG